MTTIRKIFPVYIHDKEYYVYDIEGKEHNGNNDIPKTWWLYYSEPLPEGLCPPTDSESLIPFSKSIERRLWDIKITSKNTSKEKWDEIRFSSHVIIEMWCNKRLVYSFTTFASYFEYAMSKIIVLQTQLSEHSFNFFEPERENNRKIYWYGLPATIKVSDYQSWEIRVIPDYTCGLDKEAWWAEYRNRKRMIPKDSDEQWNEMEEEDDKEDYNADMINWGDALFDQHINWFRK